MDLNKEIREVLHSMEVEDESYAMSYQFAHILKEVLYFLKRDWIYVLNTPYFYKMKCSPLKMHY